MTTLKTEISHRFLRTIPGLSSTDYKKLIDEKYSGIGISQSRRSTVRGIPILSGDYLLNRYIQQSTILRNL